MPDSPIDIGDLKREVVETRNQSIKTGNQVQNLAHDLKSFDTRFGRLEKRTRLVSVGTNVILAAVILGAAHLVHRVRASQLETALENATDAARDAKQQADAAVEKMRRQLEAVTTREKERLAAEKAALLLLDHLDAGRDKQALAVLEHFNLDDAGELAKRLAGERIAEFRRQAASAAYKAARAHLAAGRASAAIEELKHALEIEPDGRHATSARYMLATNLWSQGKWDAAVSVLRDMLARGPEKALAAEARFLLATSLARSGKRDEAIGLFRELVESGRYVGSAKAYLAALESGGELPPLTSQKRATPAAVKPSAPRPGPVTRTEPLRGSESP